MGTAGDSRQVTPASVYSIDAENQPTNTQRDEVVKPVRSWKSYVWDTWDLPPDQRWMLFKVDAFVLTFASIGYFLKNIDQSNVNNAFLSGMEEDLEMFGNQLVTSMYFYPLRKRFFLPFLWIKPKRFGAFANDDCYRHVYLDCRIRYWPNSIQPVVNQSLTSMGHPLAGGRLGTRDYLYIKCQILSRSVRFALPCRIF